MELRPPRPEDAATRDTDAWRTVSFITWSAVLVSVLVVAVSSRTIGRPIWWLGTSVDPSPRVFLLIPVAIVTAPMVVAVKYPRVLTSSGIIASVLLLVTAVPDISNSPGVASAIAVISFAALLESVALAVVLRKYR